MRFGAGGAKIAYTMILNLPVDGGIVGVECDVIDQTLPLLMGLQAGALLNLHVSLRDHEVLREGQVVGTWTTGNLIDISIACGKAHAGKVSHNSRK